MQKVLIVLADVADEALTREGLDLLKDFHISYQVRVGSAQVAPDYLRELVLQFHQQGGQAIVCLAPPHDLLASFVSSLTEIPVLNVLRSDRPLRYDQLPGPIPVANMGLGSQGFLQAALFLLQCLGLSDPELAQNLHRHRHSLAARMIAADQQHRVIFNG